MAIGLKELIGEARRTASEVPPDDARPLIEEGALVLDVREPGEFAKARIAGARNMPRGLLELRAAAGGLDGWADAGFPTEAGS